MSILWDWKKVVPMASKMAEWDYWKAGELVALKVE